MSCPGAPWRGHWTSLGAPDPTPPASDARWASLCPEVSLRFLFSSPQENAAFPATRTPQDPNTRHGRGDPTRAWGQSRTGTSWSPAQLLQPRPSPLAAGTGPPPLTAAGL